MALLAVVLAVGGFFDRSKDSKRAAEHEIPPVEMKAGGETKSARDTGRKEDRPDPGKEKSDGDRIERERIRAEESVRKATALRAPPLEKGKYHETGDFGKTMKDLSENEFKFREAKARVYRSTFDQRTLVSTPILKRFHARNAVVTPGRYDFDAGLYFLDLVFWQALYEEKQIAEGKINPARTTCVRCRLLSRSMKRRLSVGEKPSTRGPSP
jgi:hypothetical protein